MKKVVRLTESDLIRLVKKVIKETEQSPTTGNCSINCQPSPITKDDTSQVARMKCCNSKDKNSEACKTYISKYSASLKNCQNINFLQ
jgi:hypothetical protein